MFYFLIDLIHFGLSEILLINRTYRDSQCYFSDKYTVEVHMTQKEYIKSVKSISK